MERKNTRVHRGTLLEGRGGNIDLIYAYFAADYIYIHYSPGCQLKFF